MLLEKNQIIPLEITGVTAEGSGVGRYIQDAESGSGLAVFVPFTAIGDRIQCRILKVTKSHAYGRIEELITPSADRRALDGCAGDCGAFGRCGGCTWRHVTYEAELRYKWQRVADAMRRIGGITLEPQPIIGCEQPDHYRNKAQFPVAAGEHRLLVGFYAPRSHRLIEERDCRLQPEIFKTILDIIVKWAKKVQLSVYDEATHRGLLRHIYIRQAEATGEIMVCLVCSSGKLPDTGWLLHTLEQSISGLASVMVNINREDTNVVLGSACYAIWGKETITDELCGLRFRLSPQSFYQVNRRQAERLYALAAEAAALSGTETVLDLYCGTGTIGLSMAKQAGQIIGVEVVAKAVEDAVRNAADNGIENTRFLCADAAQAAAQLEREGVHPEVVVVDPPRKGCDAAVIDTIAAMAPDRVVYVSCDPATLARDLKRFEEKAYRTVRITPVDMFPRTPHVETVVLLSRKDK